MTGQRECWRDIPGYDGLYRISTTGRVLAYRGYRGKRLDTPKELHPRFGSAGGIDRHYLIISLRTPGTGERRTYQMTRLMAETWLTGLPPDYIIHLRNGDPSDVSLQNLVVDTKQASAERMRERHRQNPNKSYCRKLPVVKIDLTLEVVDAYPSARQASMDTHISRATILHYCNRQTKQSVIAPDGFIYAWDDTRRIWATLKRAMQELDEMGVRYNDPLTGRYFDLPPQEDLPLDPRLWWAEAPAVEAISEP